MNQPWRPEHVVSKEEAKKYIEKQFPELSPVELTEYGKGFDNTVFLANNAFVFRFPRRATAVGLLDKENRLLPRLSGMLPLEIPEPLYFGQPETDYPWTFTGYRAVPGQTPQELNDSGSYASIPDLAMFLKKLHQFPLETAKKLKIPFDEIQREDMAKRLPILKDNVQQLIEKQLYADSEKLNNYISGLKIIPADGEKVLVHGDLHLRNIVVDQNHRLRGIIDWGDLHIGSPAVDLSIVYSFLPPDSRKHFYKKYGEVQEPVRELARFIGVYILILLILYGADNEDQPLLEVCRKGLDWALTDS